MTFKLRSWKQAVWRGLRARCPSCGVGKLYQGYMTASATCPHCGEALHHQQADDAPPYFTIFVVGHVVVPGLLITEKIWHPPMWVHFSIWLPLTVILSLWLLPRIKGAVIGLQWAFGMHGFGAAELEVSEQKPEHFSSAP